MRISRGGPEVKFFLEEIFLGIFCGANFPGPVVEFSLEEIFLGIFYSRFSWTSGRRFFLKKYF